MAEPNALAAVLPQFGQAASAFAKTGCGLIDSLLGKPCEVAGNMLADQIYSWQWRNRLRIASRAAEYMSQHGIASREIAPEFLIPFLRDSGDAESDELQELWARLLAGGVESESKQHPMYLNLLRQMSAADAEALLSIPTSPVPDVDSDVSWYAFIPESDKRQFAISRLELLGILTLGSGTVEDAEGEFVYWTKLGALLAEVLGLECAQLNEAPNKFTCTIGNRTVSRTGNSRSTQYRM